MADTSLNLYRVTLRNYSKYSTFFCVARNTDVAFRLAKGFLDENNICFSSERELEKVELLATSDKYSDITILLLEGDLNANQTN